MNNFNEDELLDLVNENDEVVGTILRTDYDAQTDKKYFARAVWFFIKNSKGQLWIPRRVASKKRHPSALDGSAAGCVSSGESYETALVREVQEELNIDLSVHSYKEVGYLTPSNDNTICVIRAYELQSDIEPNYNKADYCEAHWMYPQEIVERIISGERVKRDLLAIVKQVYCKS